MSLTTDPSLMSVSSNAFWTRLMSNNGRVCQRLRAKVGTQEKSELAAQKTNQTN
jgi:hypothetical protein